MPRHNYITWCSIAYYTNKRIESDAVPSDIVSASLDWGVLVTTTTQPLAFFLIIWK